MKISNRLRVWLVSSALVLASIVGIYAWDGGAYVYGENEYTAGAWSDNPRYGLGTNGRMFQEYGGGNTYIQTVTDGFAGRGTCVQGWMEYGWCADNAHAGLAGWSSQSDHDLNVVPYGWYCGSSRHYINGDYQVTRHGCSYFQDPPNCDNPQNSFDYNHCPGSPIVIATGGNQNYSLSKPADGVLFDLDSDGVAEQLSWTKPDADVAFLALDRNGNGTIDNGTELFGNYTTPGVPNGFAALRTLGGINEDGQVDRDDALFASLLLWHDRNHNGISEADELTPAADTLSAIGLGYTYSSRRDGAGNLYSFEGWAKRAEAGKKGKDNPSKDEWKTRGAREFRIYDVFLVRAN